MTHMHRVNVPHYNGAAIALAIVTGDDTGAKFLAHGDQARLAPTYALWSLTQRLAPDIQVALEAVLTDMTTTLTINGLQEALVPCDETDCTLPERVTVVDDESSE